MAQSFHTTKYLLSKLGAVSPATRSKAIEIIEAAHAAGHRVRFVWGKGGGNEHGSGNALDIMVYDKAAGDFVRAYVWKHRARLRLRHVIWNQRITSTVVDPGKVRLMEDRGDSTKNHMDHNHIWFLDDKAYQPAPKPNAARTQPRPVRKSSTQIAQEVWLGKWGSGDERVRRLKNAGYDPKAIQALVNRGVGNKGSLKTPAAPRKSVAQLATEVIQGKWGHGDDRVRRLTKAGHNAKAVQAEVNRRF